MNISLVMETITLIKSNQYTFSITNKEFFVLATEKPKKYPSNLMLPCLINMNFLCNHRVSIGMLSLLLLSVVCVEFFFGTFNSAYYMNKVLGK